MKTPPLTKSPLNLAIVGLLAALAQSPAALADSFVVAAGTNDTVNKNLDGNGDTGVIEATGSLTGTGTKIAVSNNASITNSGTIHSSNNRAIRLNAHGFQLTVTNQAGAQIISDGDDAVQVQAGSSVTFHNHGSVISNDSRALNFRDTGNSTVYNHAGGELLSTEADAVRPGSNGTVYNNGLIRSTGPDTHDGIDVQSNSGVTIVNASTVIGNATDVSIIEGRHGITGGTEGLESTLSFGTSANTVNDGTFIMNITNNMGGIIRGNNGSGVNIDGWNEKQIVTITNHGLIEGTGITRDGDGVDVDGLVVLNNHGSIFSHDAAAGEVSDGVSVGGDSIINHAGGLIRGQSSSGASRGMVITGNDTHPVSGDPIDPREGIYADTTISNAGLIKGDTGSGIAADGQATGFSLTITNEDSGVIEGGGTDAIISTRFQNISVINRGTITATGSGKAVDFGQSSSSLQILGGAASISGDIDGGSSGASTLAITPGTGNTFVYSGIISHFASTQIGAGTTVLSNTVNGDVNNTGSLQPGTTTASGFLIINGNYSQSSGSLLITVDDGAVSSGDIATDSGYSRLIVNGIATLSGGSVRLAPTGSHAFAAGQRYLVIDADAGSSYSGLSYEAAGYSGAISGSLINDGDLLVILSGSSAAIGLAHTGLARSALAGLDAYTGTDPQLMQLQNAAAALGNSLEATRTGTQLAPTQSHVAQSGFMVATFNTSSSIHQRLNGLTTTDKPKGTRIWVEGLHGRARQSDHAQFDGHTGRYNGAVFGVDTRNGPWTLGAAFARSNTRIDNSGYTSSNDADIDSYGFFGYARYGATGNWYVSSSLGAVTQSIETHRIINLTGFQGETDGDFRGRQYIARAETGYPVTLAGMTVTPLAGFSYLHMKQDSYTETGNSGAELRVESTSGHSLRSYLGASIAWNLQTPIGTLVPELRAQWAHEHKHSPVKTTASFAADPTGETRFVTFSDKPVRDLTDIRLGVSLIRSQA